MDDECTGATLDLSVLAAQHAGKSQEALVATFCNDDSIFARMLRARKVLDDEPEKQKIITKSLWYFADKTLEETALIWEYVTDGRWKPDWTPPEAPVTTSVNIDDDDEPASQHESAPRLDSAPRHQDTTFENRVSLSDLIARRLAQLDNDG